MAKWNSVYILVAFSIIEIKTIWGMPPAMTSPVQNNSNGMARIKPSEYDHLITEQELKKASQYFKEREMRNRESNQGSSSTVPGAIRSDELLLKYQLGLLPQNNPTPGTQKPITDVEARLKYGGYVIPGSPSTVQLSNSRISTDARPETPNIPALQQKGKHDALDISHVSTSSNQPLNQSKTGPPVLQTSPDELTSGTPNKKSNPKETSLKRPDTAEDDKNQLDSLSRIFSAGPHFLNVQRKNQSNSVVQSPTPQTKSGPISPQNSEDEYQLYHFADALWRNKKAAAAQAGVDDKPKISSGNSTPAIGNGRTIEIPRQPSSGRFATSRSFTMPHVIQIPANEPYQARKPRPGENQFPTTMTRVSSIKDESWTPKVRTPEIHEQWVPTNLDYNLYKDGILERTNMYRKQHRAPPLTYSIELSKESQKYAEELLNENKFGHNYDLPYGENLAQYERPSSPDFQLPPNRPVDDWYNEIKDYSFELNGSINNNETGHFEQLVWLTSKEVGIGIARRDQKYVVVCYYDPGSWQGGNRENVLPKTNSI